MAIRHKLHRVYVLNVHGRSSFSTIWISQPSGRRSFTIVDSLQLPLKKFLLTVFPKSSNPACLLHSACDIPLSRLILSACMINSLSVIVSPSFLFVIAKSVKCLLKRLCFMYPVFRGRYFIRCEAVAAPVTGSFPSNVVIWGCPGVYRSYLLFLSALRTFHFFLPLSFT